MTQGLMIKMEYRSGDGGVGVDGLCSRGCCWRNRADVWGHAQIFPKYTVP